MREEDLRQVEISVTPQPDTGCGNEIECDITGTDVVDDAICLQRSNSHAITFNLPAGWAWETTTPFVARQGKCPEEDAMGGPFQPTIVSATQLQITVPQGGKAIFHYRLNFDNGKTCDPIIIRD